MTQALLLFIFIRKINCEETRFDDGVAVANPSTGCPMPRRPLMVRAALLRAATELRRSRCCDGAAQTSSSIALILRVAFLGRDAQNDESSIHFPPC